MTDLGFDEVEFEDLENFEISAGKPEDGDVIAEVPEILRKGRKKKEISVEQGQVVERESEILPSILDDESVQDSVQDDKQEPSPSPLPAGEGKKEKPYVMGKWKGRPMWQCKRCAWNTLKGEAKMMEHVEKVHGEKLKPAPVAKPKIIVVYDKYGREKR